MARLPQQILLYIRRRPAAGPAQDLRLKRTAARGGFWQGVTGGQESGESLAHAARREAEEETGYRRFTRFAPLDFRYSYPLDRARWGYLYAPEVETIDEECFGAEIGLDQGEPTLDPGEHERYVWLDAQRASALLSWPENREALRRFADTDE